ncbi:MAG: lysylphosphatidylglycerol synthase transmembrane domain-containing protein [Candidatus Hodarchaeales archaeon]|jgi:uncharacterized membrane protein YbhN (UPF0104 family)
MVNYKSIIIKSIVTIVSIAFVLWYFTTQIDWDKLLQENYVIHWDIFLLGTFLAILSNLLDGAAWMMILKFLNHRIKAIDALVSHMVGFTLGILIPVAGTVELGTKIVILKKKYPELSSEEIISSIAAIRTVFLVTAYMVWGFLIISLGYEGLITPTETILFLLTIWILLTIAIFVLVKLFTNIDKFLPINNVYEKNQENLGFFKKLFSKGKIWLRGFAKNFQYILKMSKKEKIIMFFAVFSQNIIKWISVYFIYLAVVDLPFFVVMISSVLGGFVNLIPAAIPGLVGLREIAAQWSIDIFINDENLSLIAAAIQSLGLWVFFLISGIVGLIYYYYYFRDSKIINKNSKKLDKTLSND